MAYIGGALLMISVMLLDNLEGMHSAKALFKEGLACVTLSLGIIIAAKVFCKSK